jgi:hypothetical protein
MAWSAFREQYLRRDENPVNCALRIVADVVEMISRKLRACTISEAARGAAPRTGKYRRSARIRLQC